MSTHRLSLIGEVIGLRKPFECSSADPDAVDLCVQPLASFIFTAIMAVAAAAAAAAVAAAAGQRQRHQEQQARQNRALGLGVNTLHGWSPGNYWINGGGPAGWASHIFVYARLPRSGLGHCWHDGAYR